MKIKLTLILNLCTSLLFAQERLAISTTASDKPCVLLKWFDEKVIYPEGINIYRIDAAGEKTKVNTSPIKKGTYTISNSEHKSDTSLAQYIEILNSMEPQDFKGVVSALLLVKALQSTPFALYTGIMYEDCSAVKTKEYTYEVYKIINGKEILIEKSKPQQVKPFVADKAIDSFNVVVGDSKAELKWLPEEKRFWGVNVYRKTDGETGFSMINQEPIMISKNADKYGKESYPDVFLSDEGLRNGTTYTYKIAGIDFFSRETQYSKEIAVTPKDKTPPIPPTNLKATAGSKHIELTWEDAFKSKDLKGYYIYRSLGRNGELLKITEKPLAVGTVEYHDLVEEPGTYHYFVAAVDSSGNEAKSFRSVVEVLDIFPPKPPTDFSVMPDTGRIILHWKNPTDKDFAGCRIYRTVASDASQTYVLLNSKLVRDSMFIDTLPKNAKNDFYYKIASVDSSWNMSEYSITGNARMPDVIPPSAPFLKPIEQENEALIVRWTPSPESDVRGYNLYRYETKDPDESLIKLNRKELPASISLFTDRIITHKTEYAYYLIAIDSSNNTSVLSEKQAFTFISEKPITCEIKHFATKTKKSKRVILEWSIDMDDVQGCIIYRRTSASTEFSPISAMITTGKSYTDKDIEKGQRYEYQLRVYLDNGEVCKSRSVWVEIADNAK